MSGSFEKALDTNSDIQLIKLPEYSSILNILEKTFTVSEEASFANEDKVSPFDTLENLRYECEDIMKNLSTIAESLNQFVQVLVVVLIFLLRNQTRTSLSASSRRTSRYAAVLTR